DRSSQSSFPAFAGSIHPPQLLHSVGGGAPYGGGTAAEQVGGLGMGEAAQVVVGEGKSLPLGQGGDGAPHVVIAAGRADRRNLLGQLVAGQRATVPPADHVDRFAAGNADQPCLDVRRLVQLRP